VDREGIVRYRATLEDPMRPHEEGSRETAVARIGTRPLVLSIGGPLAVPGMQVKEMGTFPLPVTPPEYRFADAIVVREVPLDSWLVAEAVRQGAGLVVIGGRGVAGREIEKVLPLTDRPPEGRAIVLLLDVSGSMEPLFGALAEATGRLLAQFAPDDRVAFVLFTHRAIASPWQRAAGAHPDLSAGAGGNTALLPAIDEAVRLLAEAKGERRLFVVSDGKWGDRADPRLAERLAALGGMHRAALFVEEDVPSEAKALFPISLTRKDDLADALRKLEDEANDRTVASAEGVAAPAPPWLEGAAPPAGAYRDLVRLYPRGVGETVVLAAGAIPIVAAWRPGGKVVMTATADVDVPALVRAVLKDTGGVRLRAWRDGDDVVAEATGSGGAPFVFGDMAVPARPVAPGRWRATLPRVRAPIEVACAGAIAAVAQEGSPGLGNRPDVAARIASSSGGRIVDASAPLEPGAGGAAVWTTLLAAALLVVFGAWRRRHT
ncbi:MAG TPA: vWA domain-containing protein, partial [Planctomycetota bacterium]|nr:vWA domain-containing protein [Planctomycetota bacterium]